MSSYWQISDFAKQVGKHTNTIDGWFKALEEKHLHYVNRNRDTGEKIYDELDLNIAKFIKAKRDDKWSLTAIYDEVQNLFDLRPFPREEGESTYTPQVVDMKLLRDQLIQEFQETFEEVAATKVQELKSHYETLIKQLPVPPSIEEQKEVRFQEMVSRRRVETALEEEASHIWSQKPVEERIKKVGLFRKEEDWQAKEQFIRNYVNQHFEKKLRKEWDIDKI